MTGRNLFRIAAAALALSTLSFAAGVAGDLSIIDPPRSGERVVLRLPPPLPENTVRAAPLAPLVRTAAAQARQVSAPGSAESGAKAPPPPFVRVQHKPQIDHARVQPKTHPQREPKPDERKSA